MKIIIIDNYDSFTYNLVHAVRKITGGDIDVVRNDELQLSDLQPYDKIILSPGPGIPSEAGLLMDIIAEYADKKSILGVCLGHQALGEHFGGTLVNMGAVLHGIASTATLTAPDDALFKGVGSSFVVGHYHSWLVDSAGFPDCLEITSVDERGQIMSFKHRTLDVRGVQFHPESVLTPEGEKMLENWLAFNC
ncbi:MAG: anthranilate synthase component II [Mangrovibacterium sp.]